MLHLFKVMIGVYEMLSFIASLQILVTTLPVKRRWSKIMGLREVGFSFPTPGTMVKMHPQNFELVLIGPQSKSNYVIEVLSEELQTMKITSKG